MQVQLRTYEIEAGSLDLFVEEWRTKILPLRLRLGFEVRGAWRVPETSEFVWVLCHAGPGDWEVLDRAYHDSEERRTMDPDPARLIVRHVERWAEEA